MVEGKYFHPEHFVCAKCSKPISGEYQTENGWFYHPDCFAKAKGLVCGVCNQTLTGEYIVVEGKPYHSECYKNRVALRCAVCGEPILGEYSTDVYNNAFHSEHLNTLEKCSNCGRLICARITNGGKKMNDGRVVCNICYAKAVVSSSELQILLDRVRYRLGSFGIALRSGAVSVQAIDRVKLNQFYGNMGSIDELRGFCKTSTKEEQRNGRTIAKEYAHTIYVLNGIPTLDAEAIIAHELTHAWINENNDADIPQAISEGSCNYISYVYLKNSSDASAAAIITRMMNNPDPVYGGGFRNIKTRFEGSSMDKLLSYLKNIQK
jgi:hypothetical protein